jgi:perosamine synthetase
MASHFIPVNTPCLDGNEKKYLMECIETGWISSEGPFVSRLEEGMAVAAGRKYGIAVCNGSIALDIAIEALDLQPGDEVIVPTFTIISCAAAIVRAGAVPVLVDCDPQTWNMTAALIKEKINARTRAVMVVHLYGLPVDMDPVLQLAAEHDLKVIEDAAEMHGQHYRGRPCGSFGDISTFSFYPNKHVTTGEGGMCLTNDDGIAARCRSLRNLCFQERRFVHERLGYNARISNLQAAVGVAQLERLPDFVDRKRRMGALYDELLRDEVRVIRPVARTDYAENIYWVYGLVLSDGLQADAEQVMRCLAARGVGSRPFFWPMHEQPVFHRMGLFHGESYPVAERLARRGLYLPSGLGLTDDEIVRAATAFRAVLEEVTGP